MKAVRLQAGLSLIELMIAMVLSLLLMLGVLQIFLSSKQTYSSNSSLTRVQESGRFAMDFITYDLRNAGYKGECFTNVNALTKDVIAAPTDDRFNLNIGLTGWNAQTKLPTYPSNFSTDKIANTDSIIVKHAATRAGVIGTTDVATDATSIVMASTTSEAANSNVVISSALGCDMFKSGAVSDTAIEKSSEGNTGNFSRAYTPSISKVLVFQSNQYYIKNGANNTPSLWRTSWRNGSANTLELVEGIHDLQFEYGMGSGMGMDRAVTNATFIKANDVASGKWNDVVAVKVRLLALGSETNVAPDVQIYDREKGLICKKGDSACKVEDSFEIPNRRLAQVFTATVSLRNQLP